MADQELYEVAQAPGSGGPALYAVQDNTAGAHVVSLDQLVGGKDLKLGGGGITGPSKINLDDPPGPEASEEERNAYYDALAAQARESREKESLDMVALARPLGDNEPKAPSSEQRKKLMEQAMQGGQGQATTNAYPTLPGGPTAEDRKKLMEQAMRGGGVPAAGLPASSAGPNAPGQDDRMRLLEQAMAQSKVAAPARSSTGAKGANAPSDEQRRSLLEQAQASSAPPRKASQTGPSEEQRRKLMEQAQAAAVPAAPARKSASGPSDEQRRKLMEQAQASAGGGPRRGPPAAGGPTAEQRQLLMQQAQKQSGGGGRGASAPSAADRQRLMQQAMQKK